MKITKMVLCAAAAVIAVGGALSSKGAGKTAPNIQVGTYTVQCNQNGLCSLGGSAVCTIASNHKGLYSFTNGCATIVLGRRI